MKGPSYKESGCALYVMVILREVRILKQFDVSPSLIWTGCTKCYWGFQRCVRDYRDSLGKEEEKEEERERKI